MGHFIKNNKASKCEGAMSFPVLFHFALFDNKLIYDIKSTVMTVGRR